MSASPISRHEGLPFEGSAGRLYRISGPTSVVLGAAVAVILAVVAARSSSLAASAAAGAAAFAIGLACHSLASRLRPLALGQSMNNAVPAVPYESLPAAERAVQESRLEAPKGLRNEDVARTVSAVVEDLRSFPVFAEIVSSQMASVTNVSEGAAHQILQGLQQLDRQVSDLLAFIQESGSEERSAQSVAELEARMANCRSQLAVFADQQRSGAENARIQQTRLAEETRSVLQVLDGVNDIARHTRMLSFNVAIEAARAGDIGRGFMVIGHEVRQLASQVQSLSTDVHARVGKLMQTVTVEFQDRADQREAAERVAIVNFAETLSGLTEQLSALLDRQQAVMRRIGQENEAIAAPLMTVMGQIQFQDIIRQQLEQVSATTRAVDQHLSELVSDLVEPTMQRRPSLQDRLDEIFSAYVMDQQRVSHRSAEGQNFTGNQSMAIELF